MNTRALFLMGNMLEMHANSIRGYLGCASNKSLNESGESGDESTTACCCNPCKVVDERRANFLSGINYISGVMDGPLDHDLGMECLRASSNKGCTPALAAMCLDDENQHVRQCSFEVLGQVVDGKCAHATKFVCKVLRANACALGLVRAPKNYDCVQELKEAAEIGYPVAAFCYGLALEKQGDVQNAMHWLHKAALEGGYATARFLLGQYYMEGKDLVQDTRKALYLMLLAANQGSSPAMHAAAMILFECSDANDDTQIENNIKAFQLLSEAAIVYDTRLRLCLTRSKLMQCDYLRSPQCPNPHFELVRCYQEGRGVAPNPEMVIFHTSKCTVCV